MNRGDFDDDESDNDNNEARPVPLGERTASCWLDFRIASRKKRAVYAVLIAQIAVAVLGVICAIWAMSATQGEQASVIVLFLLQVAATSGSVFIALALWHYHWIELVV